MSALAPTMTVRWRCPRCRALHLDRAPRGDEVFHFARTKRGAYAYVETTECCGDAWVFRVKPITTTAAVPLRTETATR